MDLYCPRLQSGNDRQREGVRQVEKSAGLGDCDRPVGPAGPDSHQRDVLLTFERGACCSQLLAALVFAVEMLPIASTHLIRQTGTMGYAFRSAQRALPDSSATTT